MNKLLKSFNKDDFYKNINLHIHSKLSDGDAEVKDIVKYFKNYKYFSITDHNCVEAYKLTEIQNCKNILTGVEFDCWYRGVLIHILGYGMDIENEQFKKLLGKNHKECSDTILRLLQARNAKKTIQTIKAAGGTVILAHPACYWCINLDNFIKSLIPFGLDGIETYYPYNRFRGVVKFHFAKTVEHIADKYNLIKTGGTDEHSNLK